MRLSGYITRITGDTIQVKLSDMDFRQIYLLNSNLGGEIECDVDDGRTITADQRKKVWAMLHDISEYTGYSLRESEEMMKVRHICASENPDYFSLSDCSIDTAKDFIEFLINFCLDFGIPFTTKVFDEIQQSYSLRLKLLKHRICYVCGKPHADVDHVDTIGSGRNRRHVNQIGYYAWSLCRSCHYRRHELGVKTFAQKYQVKPVKLTKELIESLNLSDKNILENKG